MAGETMAYCGRLSLGSLTVTTSMEIATWTLDVIDYIYCSLSQDDSTFGNMEANALTKVQGQALTQAAPVRTQNELDMKMLKYGT